MDRRRFLASGTALLFSRPISPGRTKKQPPGTPTGLSVTPGAGGAVHHFQPPTDGGAVTDYEIETVAV